MTLSLRPLLFAVFSVARYRSISWTLNKTDEKCVHSFEQKSDRRLPKVSRRRMTCLDTRTFSRERRNSLAKYMEHAIISSITLGHLRTFLMQSFHINVNSTLLLTNITIWSFIYNTSPRYHCLVAHPI